MPKSTKTRCASPYCDMTAIGYGVLQKATATIASCVLPPSSSKRYWPTPHILSQMRALDFQITIQADAFQQSPFDEECR